MIAGANTGSARIYQFTARKRSESSGTRQDAQVIELRRPAALEIVYSAGSWYHEAAVAEERARKA